MGGFEVPFLNGGHLRVHLNIEDSKGESRMEVWVVNYCIAWLDQTNTNRRGAASAGARKNGALRGNAAGGKNQRSKREPDRRRPGEATFLMCRVLSE